MGKAEGSGSEGIRAGSGNECLVFCLLTNRVRVRATEPVWMPWPDFLVHTNMPGPTERGAFPADFSKEVQYVKHIFLFSDLDSQIDGCENTR